MSAKPKKAAETRAADYHELWGRAEQLLPVLRERAAGCEELRRMPDETLRDLHDSGLFRMQQPRRVGGSELEFAAVVTFGALVARACASTAWNLINLGSHHLLLGMFSPRAQDDVWNASADTLIASSFVFPAGRAERVPGGYKISGRWPFSSGVDPSDWNLLAGQVAGAEGEPPEQRVFLLGKSQYAVHDTWFAGGLRGTGSKDVEAKDQFVPEHRTLAVADMKGGPTPGSTVNPGPLYQMPVFAMFPYMLSGVALGIAEGLIDQFAAGSAGRGKMTGAKIAAVQSVQLRLGEAAALARASRLFQVGNCREAEAMIQEGTVPDMPTKVRYRLEGAYAVDWAVKAVDVLFMLSGASGLYESGHVARAFRDAHAVKQHFSFNTDVAGTTYGRVALGLPSDNPTL
ncbi:MAG: acyl-CoA dehydrogenase family protein [Betaproteobacteria bacterium]|nr:acyl-CoA dehydrogenase family protein [Betaproteobacteria bacterium]MDH4322920.1 acyl-CoA dehydrogenase family protein [Betaproteobacteria bacterium]MDH5210051.1 acyl-CoA dehydrogenase family protein [Betaproteobacteria bacterium]